MKRIIGICLMVCLLLCACGQDATAAWQEQYDLGVKYLSDGNYEEAIIAFTAAIDIDPKRPEAYSGLADAYLGLRDRDSALAALQAGIDATGEESLEDRLEELEADSSDSLAWESYRTGLEAYFAGEYGTALERLDEAVTVLQSDDFQGEGARDLALFAGAAARTAYAMGDTDAMLDYFVLAEAHMELGPPYYNDGIFDEWGGINITHPVTDEGEVTGVIYTLLGPREDGADPEVLTQFQFDANGEPVVYGE